MNDELKKIRDDALSKLQSARDQADLESLTVSLLGRNGKLTEILRTMGKLSKEERAAVGQAANSLKKELETQFEEKKRAWRSIA